MHKPQTAEGFEGAYAAWRFHVWLNGAGSYEEIEAKVARGELRPFTCKFLFCKPCVYREAQAVDPIVPRVQPEDVDSCEVLTSAAEITGGYV